MDAPPAGSARRERRSADQGRAGKLNHAARGRERGRRSHLPGVNRGDDGRRSCLLARAWSSFYPFALGRA
jgi:hypothetical protein